MRLSGIRHSVLVSVVLLAPPSAARAQVATVEITPANSEIVAGQTLQLRAQARDAAGNPVTVPAMTWLVGPFEVAAVDQKGMVRAFRRGSAKILVRAGGKVGTADVTVLPKPPVRLELAPDASEIVLGGLTTIRATPFTEDGEPRNELTVRFASSDSGVVSVDEGGVAHGRKVGEARVTATSDAGARGSVTVRVVPNRVARLEVTGPERAVTGEVVRFAVAASDGRGGRIPNAPVRWALTGDGARVDPDGGFVAERPGAYVVSAIAGAVSASTSIRVTQRVHDRTVETVASVIFSDIYAAEGWAINDVWYVSTGAGRLYTFDITDPAAPKLVDSLMVDARLVNDISTTPDGRIGVLTREGASSRKNGIVFLDLSEPLHPRVLSEYTATVSAGVHSAFIHDHYVYLTDNGTRALKIIDFRDPKNPREVGRWEVSNPHVHVEPAGGAGPGAEVATVGRYLHDVQVKDGLAYLAYFKDGLVVLDVGNGIKGGSPENPKLVSRFTYSTADFYPPDMLAGTHTVFRFRDYLVVGDEVFPQFFDTSTRDHIKTLGRLHILDVSDIEHPRKVAEYSVPEQGSHNVWVENDVMYIGNFEAGIRVVDVSGELRGDLKAQGREIGAVRSASSKGFRPNVPMTWGAQPHKGYIFATDMASGAWVAKLTPKRLVP